MFTGLFAKFAASAAIAKVRGAWSAIPPKVRLWALIALASVILLVTHQLYAHHALKVQYKAGYAQAEKDIAEHARKLKAQVDTLTHAIAADERKKNDEAVTRIDAHADVIRVRGPGRAVCPGPPAAPSGSSPGPGPADAGLGRVPYPEWQQLLAVPFDDTVSFAKQCDINTAELKGWHSWYIRLVAAWPKASSK